MFSVGLTGGIASGKTTVSDLFAELMVPVIDTDVISRQLLDKDGAAYKQVVEHFGSGILTPDQSIDRRTLRQIVFSESGQKSWLEKMLHPLIYQACHNAMMEYKKADYVLVVVPLLFETNFQSLVDRILVVDCPPEQQINRLMKRDGIDEALAGQMLAQQMSRAQRLARAHDIIHNDDATTDLKNQVQALHRSYLARAAEA